MMRKSQYATNTIKNIQYYKRKKENSRKPLNIHLSIQTSYSESLGLNICFFYYFVYIHFSVLCFFVTETSVYQSIISKNRRN